MKVFEKDWVELKDAGIAVQKEDLGYALWQEADEMCKNSRLEGYSDWRLPTVVELKAMLKNADFIGGFHTDATERYGYYCDYWSGEHSGYANSFLVVRFWGVGSTEVEERTNSNYVRCVRTLTPATEE